MTPRKHGAVRLRLKAMGRKSESGAGSEAVSARKQMWTRGKRWIHILSVGSLWRLVSLFMGHKKYSQNIYHCYSPCRFAARCISDCRDSTCHSPIIDLHVIKIAVSCLRGNMSRSGERSGEQSRSPPITQPLTNSKHPRAWHPTNFSGFSFYTSPPSLSCSLVSTRIPL